jgi:hypothetical protein
MASYPTRTVETKIGKLELQVRSATEVFVTNHNDVKLVINRIPHALSVTFFLREEDQSWWWKDVYLRRTDRTFPDNPSRAAYDKVQEVALAEIQTWLKAEPKLLSAGKLADLRYEVEAARRGVLDLEEKLVEARKALAEAQRVVVQAAPELAKGQRGCTHCGGTGTLYVRAPGSFHELEAHDCLCVGPKAY